MAAITVLDHVPEQTQGTLMLGGKEIPFEPLGVEDIAWLSNRRPALKSMLGGEGSGGKTASDRGVREGLVTMIALAVANYVTYTQHDRRATEAEIAGLEKKASNLTFLELETQSLAILFKTFPGSEERFLQSLKEEAKPQARTKGPVSRSPRKRSTTTR